MSKRRGHGAEGGANATPNRGRLREPPIIEGSATPVARDQQSSNSEPASQETTNPESTPVEANDMASPGLAAGPLPETPAGAPSDEPANSEPAPASASGSDAPPETHLEPPAEPHEAAFAPPPRGSPDQDPADQNPPRRQPPEKRGGFGAIAAAGIGGAALAALSVYGLQQWSGDEPRTAALQTRTDALEKRLESLGSAPAPDRLAELDKRIAAVQAQAAQAAERAEGASTTAEEALQAARQASAQPNAREPEAIAKLDQRLAALEQAMAAPKSSERAGDGVATESRVAAAPTPLDVSALQDRLAALEQRLAPMDQKITTLGNQLAPVAEGLPALQRQVGEQTGALREQVASLGGRLSALEPLGERLAGLERKVEPLDATLSTVRGAVDANAIRLREDARTGADAALAVTASAVLRAVEAGRPFADALASLVALGASPERLAPLKSVATDGAPDAAALALAFAALEPRLLPAPEPQAGASIVDRLAASAASLVRIRPAGAPTGDGPADRVAAVQAALARGDIQAALAAWERLPGEAKAASSGWADQARTRVAAEQAARAVLSDAVARLGRSKS